MPHSHPNPCLLPGLPCAVNHFADIKGFEANRASKGQDKLCQLKTRPVSRGEHGGGSDGSRVAANLVTGYHLRKPSLLTPEDLRAKKGRVLQDTCAESDLQLKTKGSVPLQDISVEKTSNGIQLPQLPCSGPVSTCSQRSEQTPGPQYLRAATALSLPAVVELGWQPEPRSPAPNGGIRISKALREAEVASLVCSGCSCPVLLLQLVTLGLLRFNVFLVSNGRAQGWNRAP
ncbi:hypothetical protein CB1_000418023 [Camelus ferus]|nr:hypothetical protein CB1_000418023 [Camelus ferus]